MTDDLILRVFGARPYGWQQRLLDDWFQTGRLPQAVDIPTGLGKTKVIAAWLCARMRGADLPRRLVYVVDRRTVVDQATVEAEEISSRAMGFLDDDALDGHERALCRERLGLLANESLAISTLRGQHIDNRRWMERPFGTSIVVGTVDMIGSRLLFSGYGVSRGMRPAHAGLLGSDTLVVLDEAHLVPAFETLLDEIAAMNASERESNGGMNPPFRTMALSATGRRREDSQVFSLSDDDFRDPRVRARLDAAKRLFLHATVPTGELPSRLAELAWERGSDGRRVIVFCNSRAVAQNVESDLAERARKTLGKDAKRTGLLVGERRLYERTLEFDPPEGKSTAFISTFSPGATLDGQPAFLVATSAGEVGIDLDADDLVCDLVAWERMVQRFGRVNRRPDPGVARIDVVPSLSEKDAEDTIEADRLRILEAPFRSEHWPVGEDGARDASPGMLRKLRDLLPEETAAATTKPPLTPKLDRPTVQAWAMTSLRQHSGRVDIQPYLRGWIEDRPQAKLVWRRHFPFRAGELKNAVLRFRENSAELRALIREFEAFFEAAPPHVTEILEAPADKIADVIKKRAEVLLKARDAETRGDGDGQPVTPEPAIVLLDASNGVEDLYTLEKLSAIAARPGALARVIAARTLVVDARLGGLAPISGLLDAKADVEPPTIDSEDWELPLDTYGARRIRWGEYVKPASESAWRLGGYRWLRDPDSDDGTALWVEVFRKSEAAAGDPAITRHKQTLADHHEWTRDEATRSAQSLQLPELQRRMLELAAANHDAGKARELWQRAMRADENGGPYAKTTGGAIPSMLAGYRHEFGSLTDVSRDDAFAELDGDHRELALHLLAAHHGYGRPVIAPFDPHHPPSRSVALAREVALRYASLDRKIGTWALAWWEAVLRAADWAASARVNEEAEADRVGTGMARRA